jgi:osmotically-inducible protein OsmY
MIPLLLWLSSVARAGQGPVTDQRLAVDVRRRVDRDGVVTMGRGKVEVSVRGGVVTLTGAVEVLRARERVVALVRSTRGVRAVVDLLTLGASRERDDGRVQRSIASSLQLAPALDGQPITVEVNRAVVTLSGEVRSYVDRALAGMLAKDTRGVVALSNRIAVAAPARRDDREIERDVYARLYHETRVNAAFVTAEVDDGVVRIDGYVSDRAARELIELRCWVVGVRRVDGSNLRVDALAAAPGRRGGLVIKSGQEIERDIRAALAHDPRLRGARAPSVSALAGVVTLSGAVPTFAQRRAAGQDAANTPGVVRVHNVLAVDPGPGGGGDA